MEGGRGGEREGGRLRESQGERESPPVPGTFILCLTGRLALTAMQDWTHPPGAPARWVRNSRCGTPDAAAIRVTILCVPGMPVRRAAAACVTGTARPGGVQAAAQRRRRAGPPRPMTRNLNSIRFTVNPAGA